MKKDDGGFSLVELIIVIAIMAVLAGALAPMLINYIQKSRDSKAMTNARNFETAVEASLIDASEGTLGSDAERDASGFSVQYLSSNASAPNPNDSTHSLIASIYNSFDPKGQGFEAIAVVDTGKVQQITYKDLKTRKVYVYYADDSKKYGTRTEAGKAGEWLRYDTNRGDSWVSWYSICEGKYTTPWWNGHQSD